MTRIGINPARGKISDYRPARVSVAILTYLPDLDGYFKNRFEVLKLVFASLGAHTTAPYDLVVFDNGSCGPVVDYLRALQIDEQIDYLILSQGNIGKIGALRVLFNAVPGEIIAYCDDDILFYPGWLEAHLEILDHFPKAGMVSGTPVRNASRHAHGSLDRLVNNPPPEIRITSERRILEEWELDWAISTGRNPAEHIEATKEWQDTVLLTPKSDGSGNYEAIGSANHFQYVAPKELILKALPADWSGKLMGSMIELDEAVDALGCLRLSTTQRYCRHLGNDLSAEVIQEAKEMGLIETRDGVCRVVKPHIRRRHPLLRIPGGRRVLSAIYSRLFDILFR